MKPVETYFRDLGEIRSTGANVPETSYYGALENSSTKSARPSSQRSVASFNWPTAGRGIPTADSSRQTSSRREQGSSRFPARCPSGVSSKSNPLGTTHGSPPRGSRYRNIGGNTGWISITRRQRYLPIHGAKRVQSGSGVPLGGLWVDMHFQYLSASTSYGPILAVETRNLIPR